MAPRGKVYCQQRVATVSVGACRVRLKGQGTSAVLGHPTTSARPKGWK